VPPSSAAKTFLAAFAIILLVSPAPVAVAAGVQHNQFSMFIEPGAGDGPVLSLIRGARHSIKLEVYILSDIQIMQALRTARTHHVDVQVLLEQHPLGASRYAGKAYDDLKSAGISVRWANEAAFNYTHEKSMVVDGTRAGIFTFNLSYSAFESNREFGVVDRNIRDAREIAGVFNADWSRHSFGLTDNRIVVSPINSRRSLQGLVGDARHTIDLYAEEVNDSTIESRLIGAEHHGVRVRVLTSSVGSGVDRLRGAGIKVRIQKTPYVHAKAIVVDGNKVFIGSENLSTTSLDSNREMGIILPLKNQSQIVEGQFARDWRSASPERPGSGGKGHLAVHVSTQPKSVVRGQFLRITATSVSGASCTIKVTYPDGFVSHAAALHETIADGAGLAQWGWHVGSTARGISSAAVTCFTVKATGHGSVTFRIR
jgi:phosphatidylserine/phosphatidylglycerophosphate/cardiolipin synthase-like enzyme